MASYGPADWKPRIIGATAVSGDGIDDLAAAIDSHRDWLTESGELQRRRQARARREISAIAIAELQRRADGLAGVSRLDGLAEQVSAGALDPYAAADELIALSRDST
jgi:LAO/AO transport system kinase